MNKVLRITSTSFLIPKNSAWNVVGEKYEILFSDYADWTSTFLSSKKSDYVVGVVFLEDLIRLDFSTTEEELVASLTSFLRALKSRLEFSVAPTLIFSYPVPEINPIRRAKHSGTYRKIYMDFISELEQLSRNFPSFFHIDLEMQFSKLGQDTLFDYRNWYFANCRLSVQGLRELAGCIGKVFHRCENPSSKLLVLDCDNTIWGGIVGEDGVGSLTLGNDGLGRAFVDFQFSVKRLISEGIIVALASKNNEQDVWDVFDNHPNMILKRQDIISAKINWNEKSDNLKQLSEDLDLGLDSFVFWDDNPLERAKMKALLPEILTVDVPDSILEWPSFLAQIDCFAKFVITDDDNKKTEQYHSRAKFIRDSRSSLNELDYLKSIKLIPKAHEISNLNVSRAEQLCAKTNQFNMRTIRHKSVDLLEMTKVNNEFSFLVSLSDIYGDHGIVGLVCLRHFSQKYIFIDTLLLSCRVLGRHLEAWILLEIIKRIKKCGYRYLLGEFIPSKKNIVAKDFFVQHNFRLIQKDTLDKSMWQVFADDQSFLYAFDLDNSIVPYKDLYEDNI